MTSFRLLIAELRCLVTGKYSDLVITCKDDSYSVHKVVVCNRADFFARAVKFGGKVRTHYLGRGYR
jgi:hypothetical protein